MIDFDDKVSRIELEMASLREKINFFAEINLRLEATLNRFQNMMEERRDDINIDIRDIHSRIDSIEDLINEHVSELENSMRNHYEEERTKIEDLNRWRWILLGAATVLGWLISHLSLGSLFGDK